jgi:hypothetical protein
MTAKLCFKIGKYLNNTGYKMGIFTILESVPEIESVDLTILIDNNLGLKKDGITIAEARAEIEKACRLADEFPDAIKNFILEKYLEANPEERE